MTQITCHYCGQQHDHDLVCQAMSISFGLPVPSSSNEQSGGTPSVLNGQVESPSVSNLPPVPTCGEKLHERLSLSERLRSWAQNEEMIDAYYTAHGRDCNEAAIALSATGRSALNPAAAWPFPSKDYHAVGYVDLAGVAHWEPGRLPQGVEAMLYISRRADNTK